MPKIIINNQEIDFEEGMTVLQACEIAGAEIPRFCYHERLSIAGNCRMCLVELEKSAKPIASCAMPATEGMNIKTNTKLVDKARKGVMEFLLTNHPLDCPVCDQGGECDLQDQSMFYGFDKSRYLENKREVKEKYMGPLIKTQMTRCIHCTRCIRFASEVAGVTELGAIGRGENMEITTYLEKSMTSEMSANVIDLCPVGALTSKPYAFEARPWELKKTESIDVMDAVGSNIRVDTLGWEVKRILPRINENINEEWISDKTRYACDGLSKQRLDTPLIKENGKFKKISWEKAIDTINAKLKLFDPKEIAGVTGDLNDLEMIFAFKKFFNNCLDSNNLECRNTKTYINPTDKINYIFNSSINGIEESDLIILIGSNPRVEATIVNSRIRKAYLNNKTEIYTIGDPGNLTYPYKSIGSDTTVLRELVLGNTSLSNKIKKAKKPMIIIGESALNSKSGEYIFESVKKFLHENNFINKNWNALNVLTQQASRVGAITLGVYSINNNNNFIFFDKLENNEFKFLYLLGADEIKFKKNDNMFVVYQGSHGDKGANAADLILPGAAYTEKNGSFMNLEGRLQKTYRASYPPGEAKEDWKILKEISVKMKKNIGFENEKELTRNLYEEFGLSQVIDELPQYNEKNIKINEVSFFDNKILINDFDYYHSNPIARSSKTMNECKQAFLKNNIKNGK